jgi:UDP-N-acetylmuramate--alanine ligase
VYDDYAHHPTEVAAALEALRDLDPRRLIAVFQPHLYSRTKALASRFGAALAAADEVGVLEVYPARERPVGELAGVSGLSVARAVAERASGRPVWWLVDVERAERALRPRLRDGDLLVTIGAGDVYRLADALVEGAR